MANNFLPPSDPSPRDLDRQIDRALETYLPQPRTGLEQRILARTQTTTPRPAWRQPRFAFLAAIAVAACALLAILFPMPGHNAAPLPVHTVATNPPQSTPRKTPAAPPTPTHLATLTTRPTPKAAVLRKPRHAQSIPQETNLPHLAVFPAPASPTPQEQQLAELAVRNPKLLKEATQPIPTATPKPIVIQPIQIDPIKIAPLSVAQIDAQQNPIPHHPENAP